MHQSWMWKLQSAQASQGARQTCPLAIATDGSSDLDSQVLSGDGPCNVVDFFGCGTRLSMKGSARQSGLPARDNSCKREIEQGVSTCHVRGYWGDQRWWVDFCDGSREGREEWRSLRDVVWCGLADALTSAFFFSTVTVLGYTTITCGPAMFCTLLAADLLVLFPALSFLPPPMPTSD